MQIRITAFVVTTLLACGPAAAQDMPADYQEVLAYLGRTGDFRASVLKVGVPRDDLQVAVAGVRLPTAFGFGGWLALTRGDGDAVVMTGDLVLLETEVAPVMSALLEHDLDVTALHNHFFYDEPRLFYLHVHGAGAAMDLAQRVKPALDLIGREPPPPAADAPPMPTGTLDTATFDQIVGQPGERIGDVYKYTISRNDLQIMEMGAEITARMGLNSWAALVGSNADAVIAGDVAMLAWEVTPVLKALRGRGLEIVAIHHHMTNTQPLIVFLHYWGRGPAEQLVRGFREALVELGR